MNTMVVSMMINYCSASYSIAVLVQVMLFHVTIIWYDSHLHIQPSWYIKEKLFNETSESSLLNKEEKRQYVDIAEICDKSKLSIHKIVKK